MTILAQFSNGHYGQTTLHPVALAALLLLALATAALPRRHVLLPLLVVTCFIPSAQRVVVFGLDFTFIRIIVSLTWLRLFARNELRPIRWNWLDGCLCLWAISGTMAYTLLYGSAQAFTYKAGIAFDALGIYFAFRLCISTFEEFRCLVRTLALLGIPVAMAFLVERATGRNVFSAFGGVAPITIVRDGRLRCQGAFQHPILAGCFWAGLLPLFAALWWAGRRSRTWAIVGSTAAAVIVGLCASSTAVLSLAAGAFAVAAYRLRSHLWAFRWSLLLGLLALHAVMNAPVWHLLARVNVIGGSTGWHRYHLIDAALRRFGEWALVGTQSTRHWGTGLADITNHYILEGVRGGVLTLCLFVATIVIAYSRAGQLWRNASNDADARLGWALGASLTVHCLSFLAVSYFGQNLVGWYLVLGALGGIQSSAQAVPQTMRTSGATRPIRTLVRRRRRLGVGNT